MPWKLVILDHRSAVRALESFPSIYTTDSRRLVTNRLQPVATESKFILPAELSLIVRSMIQLLLDSSFERDSLAPLPTVVLQLRSQSDVQILGLMPTMPSNNHCSKQGSRYAANYNAI